MTPEAAVAKQIELYRKMTGQQRLQIALSLRELACEVTREGIRHDNPNASSEEVERSLRERIQLGHRLREHLCRP